MEPEKEKQSGAFRTAGETMSDEKKDVNQGEEQEVRETEGPLKRLYDIRKKREQKDYRKILAGGGAAVAVVAAVAIAGGVLGDRMGQGGVMRVETAAASLETTAPPETDPTQASIVLETTLSDEEAASKAYAETVQSVLDSYANLGIAEVSGYLNIRKTPESFGEVIGELPRGGACEILDTSVEGWYKISSGGVTGYVSSQYVHTGEKAREMASTDVKERAIIEADKLNVRAEASQDSEIVGQVMKDERYLVLGEEDGWIQIEDGYISSDYVTVRYALNEAHRQDMRTTVLNLYDNLGISNVTNYLNVRDEPSETDGEIIGKLPGNAGCDILEEPVEGWYRIRSGDITGYVKAEYILTGQEAKDKAMEVAQLMAYANTDGVNVRTEPSTDAAIWTQISNQESFLVLSQQDGWVEVAIDDTNAFISSDYVDVRYGLNEAIPYSRVVAGSDSGSSGGSSGGSAGSKSGSVSSRRAEIANYAVQFVGNPYVYGGSSLTNGADCSGFTMAVMAHFGVSLPHHSASQANCGRAISASEMRPGDLVFYAGSDGTINHVALYIGNGQVCHASSARTGIKISTWNYRTPAKIVNVLGD